MLAPLYYITYRRGGNLQWVPPQPLIGALTQANALLALGYEGVRVAPEDGGIC